MLGPSGLTRLLVAGVAFAATACGSDSVAETDAGRGKSRRESRKRADIQVIQVN